MPRPVRTVSLRIPGLQGPPEELLYFQPSGCWALGHFTGVTFHRGRKYALGDLGEMRCIIHFLKCFLTLLPSGHPETCLLNVNEAFY